MLTYAIVCLQEIAQQGNKYESALNDCKSNLADYLERYTQFTCFTYTKKKGHAVYAVYAVYLVYLYFQDCVNCVWSRKVHAVYLLCLNKSTQFPCCTSTKVQVLKGFDEKKKAEASPHTSLNA
jgi:hypothetical protein